MKKAFVLVQTRKGGMYVPGYDLENGLYVHRLIHTENTLRHRLTNAVNDSYEVLNSTRGDYWSITHGISGLAVKTFAHIPMCLKAVMFEVGKIIHLDWKKKGKELGTENYRNAVREMRG